MRRLRLDKYLTVCASLLKNKTRREDIYPFYASFKLTSRCHFACEFCNIKDEKDRPDMPTEKVKRILDNLSGSSVILVSFEGGEPLLRSDIGELLQYARKKDFYLLFTTSERHLERYPMKAYAKYIDFLHVSIDEGHNNLEMFERLGEFKGYGGQLSVQVVVTRETLPALEAKVKTCHAAGANMVIMPAVHMERTGNVFPDINAFEDELKRLKKKYQSVIYTPDGYCDAVKSGRCSTASIIIDSDGGLYYPCHILEKKGPDLSQASLMGYLETGQAKEARRLMAKCGHRCGWFQYFSIPDFVSVKTAFRSLKPMLSKLMGK